MYEPLFYRAENASVELGLAESFQYTDPVTVEVKLRKNVTFHDGTPLKAEHVIKSFKLMKDPKQGSDFRYRLSVFKDIELIDNYTFKIITMRPYAPALYVLAKYLPIFYLKKYDSGSIRNGQWPIGTGPYIMNKKGPSIELIRYDKYHSHKPYYNKIVFSNISTEEGRKSSLIKGNINVVTDISYKTYQVIKNSSKHILVPQNQLMAYIGMNTNKSPFDDVRVRQAINYSINRKAINEEIFWGNATIAAGAFSPIMLGYDPKLEPYSYDPEKAQKLLREAGYPGGITLKINFYPNLTRKTSEQLDMIRKSLAASNIKAEPQQWDISVFRSQLRTGNFKDMFLASTFLDTEPELFLSHRFLMDPKQSYFYNKNIAEGFLNAAVQYDTEKRSQIYQAIDKYIKQQSPWVFLYSYPTKFVGISNQVNGLEVMKMASFINPVLYGRTTEYCKNCVCKNDKDCKACCPKCW